MSNNCRYKIRPKHLSDKEIIDSVLHGDHYAYRYIVEKYESRIAAVVIGMLGPCPEADDVGQEVFIRFFNNIKTFRGDSAVITFLTRIAINLSLNELRRRKRRFQLIKQSTSDENFDIADSDNTEAYDEKREFVQKAIQQLDSIYREVVLLRLINGYSTKQTAEILEIPVGTVLSRLARAQSKLRIILSPYFGRSDG